MALIDDLAICPISDWLEVIAAQGLPVLFLRGSKSLIWPKDSYEAAKTRFHHCANFSFREIAEAGHGLPFEQKAEFVKQILDFYDNFP